MFAFFFNSNFSYYRSKGLLNGTLTEKMSMLSGISMLGIVVFWIVGLFVADHWWQPVLTLAICVLGLGLLGAVIDAILPRSIARLIGGISPIIAMILTIVAYVVWY